MKKQKGITLIALVVTIVVLLILTGVALNLVLGENGIIAKAQEARVETDIAEVKEQIKLRLMGKYDEYGSYTNDDVIDAVKQITGNEIEVGVQTTTTKKGNTVSIADLWVSTIPVVASWTQDKTSVTNGEITLEVGKKVTGYSVKTTGSWYVLGAEDGKLLITTKYDQGKITLSGKDGYVNGVSILNTEGEKYNDGNMADYARSINVEDINRVTGYDPDVANFSNGVNRWKNEVTYTLNSDGTIHYQGTKYPTTDKSSTFSAFTYWNGNSWASLNNDSNTSKTIVQDYYIYYPQTLSASQSSETKINGSTNAYQLLFGTSISKYDYWLSSQSVYTDKGNCVFGMRLVYDGYVRGDGLVKSDDTIYNPEHGFRPVVSLKANVEVTSNGELSI